MVQDINSVRWMRGTYSEWYKILTLCDGAGATVNGTSINSVQWMRGTYSEWYKILTMCDGRGDLQ